MLRYLRAFFIALKMTITGEQPQPVMYPNLQQWMRDGQKKVDAVYRTAKNLKIDRSARENILFDIDKRKISFETILATVHFHLTDEYVSLIRFNDAHTLTTIYALNIDDQYRVHRLLENEKLMNTSLKDPLEELAKHLETIPPSTNA